MGMFTHSIAYPLQPMAHVLCVNNEREELMEGSLELCIALGQWPVELVVHQSQVSQHVVPQYRL